ncbi:MAG TPA: hypothetical protein VFQ22_13210, partial [Longimicrobiales bacterium]|nr:hypothetical protein [Longimicrobiales bacterium]
MKIERPERFAEMVVCRDCGDVVGWFHDARAPDEKICFQHGRCREHPPRPHAPRWPGYDFNRVVDLCYGCGLELVSSGSRLSTWFCAACKTRVALLNRRHGRCIVPLGRHPMLWGSPSDRREARDPVTARSSVDASKAIVMATMILSDWQRIVVGLNLDAMGARDEPTIPVFDYRSAATTVV